MVSYRNLHRSFFRKFQLAVCVGLWVAFFGLFVYWHPLNCLVFGNFSERSAKINGINVTRTNECKDQAKLGWQDRNGLSGKLEELQVKPAKGNWYPEDAPNGQVWCGYLPKSYEGYWPNVIQMIIFTVYVSTGSTVKLAWQGVMGTLCAVLNIGIMNWMFPYGSFQQCPTINLTCAGVDMVYKSAGYHSAYGWIDVFGVLLLFLLSNAAENTIKFGMSWHIYFMMGFMNPTHNLSASDPGYSGGRYVGVPDSEASIVIFTGLFGGLLAIIATLIPFPLLNISKTDDDALAAVKALQTIWTESIEYFCGEAKTPKRWQIEAKIVLMTETVTRIQGNLADSWWETFNLCSSKRRRSIYQALDKTISELRDVMYCVKHAIAQEKFKGSHNDFCRALKPCMVELKDTASEMLLSIAKSGSDGNIDDREMQDIRDSRLAIEQAQNRLVDTVNQFIGTSDTPYICKDLSSEVSFCYALSIYGKRVCEIEDALTLLETKHDKHCFKHMWNVLQKGFLGTWDCRAMFATDHWQFVARNFIGITICYIMGHVGSGKGGHVFVSNSSTMASTLALLISHFNGSALKKDLHRLLGLALGKVLPVLLLALLHGLSIDRTGWRSLLHFFLLFLYMTVFVYMYYTSKNYTTEGCLIAGFGCYSLVSTSTEFSMNFFALRYQELTLVTLAIAIQMVVDGLWGLLPGVHNDPRDLALEQLDNFSVALNDGFESFFNNDIVNMNAHTATAKACLAQAITLGVEASPEMEVVPCLRTPFKIQLFQDATETCQHITADLRMLGFAVENWKPVQIQAVTQALKEKDESNTDASHDSENEDLPEEISSIAEFLNSKPSNKDVHDDIMHSVTSAMNCLSLVLSHADESTISEMTVNGKDDMESARQLKKLEYQDNLRSLQGKKGMIDEINQSGLDKLMKQAEADNKSVKDKDDAGGNPDDGRNLTTDMRARFTVALEALSNTVKHVADIDKLLVKGNVY